MTKKMMKKIRANKIYCIKGLFTQKLIHASVVCAGEAVVMSAAIKVVLDKRINRLKIV